MPTGLQIAHGGYAAGVKASKNQATKKKRDSPPLHLFQPFCVCIDNIVLSFTVFCFCSKPQKHQWVCCVFLFNLPHSSPSKPFLCKRALIFTTKTLNPHPHPHPCLHQSKPDRHHHHKIWPPSKQPLNKLSLQHKHIHPPSHGICHHHPTCISLPIATIFSCFAIDGFADWRVWVFYLNDDVLIIYIKVGSHLGLPGSYGSRVNPPGRPGFSEPNP